LRLPLSRVFFFSFLRLLIAVRAWLGYLGARAAGGRASGRVAPWKERKDCTQKKNKESGKKGGVGERRKFPRFSLTQNGSFQLSYLPPPLHQLVGN
jgi:hypothetical protein